jgi:hypothetical protein
MSKPRESAHVQMARAVALLRAKPLTHADLRDAVGVHKDVPSGWTSALHAVGLVYISDWVSAGRGPKMALWAWQDVPFGMPDAVYVGVPPRPRKMDRAMAEHRLQVIADRRARIAAVAVTKKTARDEAMAARDARRAARRAETAAAEDDTLPLTPVVMPPAHLRSIFDLAGAA